jgi:hypothetical protein
MTYLGEPSGKTVEAMQAAHKLRLIHDLQAEAIRRRYLWIFVQLRIIY